MNAISRTHIDGVYGMSPKAIRRSRKTNFPDEDVMFEKISAFNDYFQGKFGKRFQIQLHQDKNMACIVIDGGSLSIQAASIYRNKPRQTLLDMAYSCFFMMLSVPDENLLDFMGCRFNFVVRNR